MALLPPAGETVGRRWVKKVGDAAEGNPWPRGGHKQVAVIGAVFKKRWQAWWKCSWAKWVVQGGALYRKRQYWRCRKLIAT